MSHIDHPIRPYENTDEIQEVVRRFETCTFDAGEFRHREHLTVILWYISQFSAAEATARMREGLYKFLDHHNVDRRKYHETITLFWVKRVKALLDEAGKEHSLAEIANEVVKVCHDANLIDAYYSRALLASTAAREGWVEPDLQLFDF